MKILLSILPLIFLFSNNYAQQDTHDILVNGDVPSLEMSGYKVAPSDSGSNRFAGSYIGLNGGWGGNSENLEGPTFGAEFNYYLEHFTASVEYVKYEEFLEFDDPDQEYYSVNFLAGYSFYSYPERFRFRTMGGVGAGSGVIRTTTVLPVQSSGFGTDYEGHTFNSVSLLLNVGLDFILSDFILLGAEFQLNNTKEYTLYGARLKLGIGLVRNYSAKQ